MEIQTGMDISPTDGLGIWSHQCEAYSSNYSCASSEWLDTSFACFHSMDDGKPTHHYERASE